MLIVVFIIQTGCASLTPTQPATPTRGAIPVQPTRTPIPSLTPTARPATASPTPSLTATAAFDSQCFQVEFIEDVTIPDGASMRPLEVFLKIWRLRNSGDCAWEGTLILAYEKGVRMRSPDEIPASLYTPDSNLTLDLGQDAWVDGRVFRVEPGQAVDIPVVLQAPLDPGFHRVYFLLFDPSGGKMEELYAVIYVREDETPGDWSGVWWQRMASFLEGDSNGLYLDQSGVDMLGFFYLPDGRLLLLQGRVSEDGQQVAGLWGEPWTDGSQFEWRRTGDDAFQGSFLSPSMPGGIWCGIPSDRSVSAGNCLLGEP